MVPISARNENMRMYQFENISEVLYRITDLIVDSINVNCRIISNSIDGTFERVQKICEISETQPLTIIKLL